MSEQLFVDLNEAAAHLRLAIERGAVDFVEPRWRQRALDSLAEIEPWCVSRQYWWGQGVPDASLAGGQGRDAGAVDGEPDVLSVWFSLVAWSLHAAGWPQQAQPTPIDVLYADADLLERWVLPSQMLALALTGRPAFRQLHIHGGLQVVRRQLSARPSTIVDTAADTEDDAVDDAGDEQRFVLRTVRRPMRRAAGNTIEPETLIDRFGADALRLGYLLALGSDHAAAATLAESSLRRARRTVHRLTSKVGGLYSMLDAHVVGRAASDEDAARPLPLADAWLLARCTDASDDAKLAYQEHRTASAARVFCQVIDDFSRYARVAANRRKRRPEDLSSVATTVSTAIDILAAGFAPICPFALTALHQWTQRRSQSMAIDSIDRDLPELIDQLRRLRGQAVDLGSPEPTVIERLHHDRSELIELSGAEVTISDSPGPGLARRAGSVIVVATGERWASHPSSPAGDDAVARWYQELHS